MGEIFWELIRHKKNKNGKYYKIIDRAKTSTFNIDVPVFKKEQAGDIKLAHKDTGIEIYTVE